MKMPLKKNMKGETGNALKRRCEETVNVKKIENWK